MDLVSVRPLAGKVALITGSATGIGNLVARTLAAQGCHVSLNYVRRQQEAEVSCAYITATHGVQAIALYGDVGQRDDVASLVTQTQEKLGHIDICIHNAGPFLRQRKRFAAYSEEDMHMLVETNLLGVLRLNRLLLPAMRQQRWGRIVHFGFGHSGEAPGWPERAVYAASKVALVSFTKSLAVEEAHAGITVNMVCPGDIKGDYKEAAIAQAIGKVDEENPPVRPGTGEDVARVVAFLCHPQSDYVTGNVIDVHGGYDPIRATPARSYDH